jgi:hypothetical protein
MLFRRRHPSRGAATARPEIDSRRRAAVRNVALRKEPRRITMVLDEARSDDGFGGMLKMSARLMERLSLGRGGLRLLIAVAYLVIFAPVFVIVATSFSSQQHQPSANGIDLALTRQRRGQSGIFARPDWSRANVVTILGRSVAQSSAL